MVRIRSCSVVAIFGVLICIAGNCQKKEARAMDGSTRESIASIYIPPLTNVPFSATVRTEWVKRLADGSTLTVKNHRLIARDAAGRIFQERRFLTPDDDQKQSRISQTELFDPASNQRWYCYPGGECRQFTYKWPRDGSHIVHPGQTMLPDNHGTVTIESLGSKTMEGVDVDGSRETTVINPGVVGNDRPLTIVKEFWYSPALRMNLLTVRDDPRFGVQTFQVTDLSSVSPDAKLFALPAGARVAVDETLGAEQ